MESDKSFYIIPNDNKEGYDIMKRNAVIQDDGTLGDERILTIYSVEYIEFILETLINGETTEG